MCSSDLPSEGSQSTQEDISTLVKADILMLGLQGSEAGVIEKQEHEMVRNVFRLDDRQIGHS